ncbi:MAG: DUF2273 domain-containing protein [Desulfitobacteriaceae bacterium]
MNFGALILQKISHFLIGSLEKHPGKLLGTSLGFLFGLLLVILGFWRALALSLFILAGFIIGKRYDEHKNLGNWLERFFQK